MVDQVDEPSGDYECFLLQALKVVNEAEWFGRGNEVTFVLDRATSVPAIHIVTKFTRPSVAQLPPESVLKLAATIVQSMLGDQRD